MIEIRNYFMCIVTVCFLCSMLIHLTSGLKTSAYLIRILCGILIAVTVFRPVAQLNWNDLEGYLGKIKLDAQITADEGSHLYYRNKTDSIQSKLRTYILDKAACYDCKLDVQVELSEKDPPIPVSVTIQGSVSPYQRRQLTNIIETDLGIPKEMQTWNAVN